MRPSRIENKAHPEQVKLGSTANRERYDSMHYRILGLYLPRYTIIQGTTYASPPTLVRVDSLIAHWYNRHVCQGKTPNACLEARMHGTGTLK